MPGETPDYGRLSAQATVFPVTDLGELAVRLGSPLIYNRSGDVIFMDDFAAGFASWTSDQQGTLADTYLSYLIVRRGIFSVRLLGGSSGSRYAAIRRALPAQVASRLGLETSVNLSSIIDTFELYLFVYDGTNLTTYRVRYDDTNNRLDYWNAAGAWAQIAGSIALPTFKAAFNNVKVVVDASASRYVKLLVNSSVYDLSTFTPQVAADATAAQLRFELRLVSRAGQNDSAYLDDVIVTQNEPA